MKIFESFNRPKPELNKKEEIKEPIIEVSNKDDSNWILLYNIFNSQNNNYK